jgi:DNA-binding IclR family transcriptional regulator
MNGAGESGRTAVREVDDETVGEAPPGVRAQGRQSRGSRVPHNHRTVDRVTRILEEVVYKPGMTFAELARALEAPKSSVHGFISGLLAKGWLFELNHRFFLGPAVYGLTLASGQIRAGLVTNSDLLALHEATGTAVFLGVEAGDHLIYVAEAGVDAVAGFEARSNIRRTLLATAGGKAMLAQWPGAKREAYLRRCSAHEAEQVVQFLNEVDQIRRTRLAINVRQSGSRFAIGTTVHSQTGEAVAAITLVGPTEKVQPRLKSLGDVLLRHADSWAHRALSPREAI